MESVTRSKTEGERALSKEQRQTEWRVTIRDRPQTGCHTQTHTDTTTHNQKERESACACACATGRQKTYRESKTNRAKQSERALGFLTTLSSVSDMLTVRILSICRGGTCPYTHSHMHQHNTHTHTHICAEYIAWVHTGVMCMGTHHEPRESLERAWDADADVHDAEAHFDQHVLLPVDVDLHRVALILSRIQWTTANRHRGDGTGRGLRERQKFGWWRGERRNTVGFPGTGCKHPWFCTAVEDGTKS